MNILEKIDSVLNEAVDTTKEITDYLKSNNIKYISTFSDKIKGGKRKKYWGLGTQGFSGGNFTEKHLKAVKIIAQKIFGDRLISVEDIPTGTHIVDLIIEYKD